MARPRSDETKALEARVLALRGQRLKWDDIAQATGYSVGHVHTIYQRAISEIPVTTVVRAREEECRLVDDAIRRLLEDIANDEGKTTTSSFRSRIEAWGQIRAWSEHRARMLGLNAPIKSQVQVITEDHIDTAIRDLEAKLAANDQAPADARAET